MHNTSSLSDSKILAHLLEYSNDLICIFNEKGESELISNSVESILGFKREELIGQPYTLFLHPNDLQRTASEKEKIQSKNPSFSFENRCLHKNGSTVYLQWTSSYDEHLKKIYGIARDITATKIKLQAEKRDIEINRALINSTNSLVWSLDKDYCFTGFNRAFKESREKEYQAKIEIGVNTFDSMKFSQEVIDEWKPIYQKVLAGQSLDFEYNTAHLEGKTTNIKWHKIELKPIILEDEVIGILGSSTDITDIKQTTIALSERNQLIESVIKEIPMGVAVNEIDSSETVFVNNQFSEVYNWPADQLSDVRNFLNKIYPPENKDAQRILKKVTADIKSGDPSRMIWNNIPVTGQDGTTRYVNAKNIPLFDQNLMISTVQDNTAAHLNKLALQRAYIEKNEILDGISDAFYTLDADYNFTFLNKHSLDIMEMEAVDLIGKNLFNVFPELKDTLFFNHLENVRRTEEAAKFEFYYELFDTWFDERIYKTPTGFSVFFVDISIKKSFSLQIEAAYQKQNEILESITDAFIGLDKNYCFNYVNREAENVFKLNKDKLIGEYLWDIFPLAHGTDVYVRFQQTLSDKVPNAFEYYYPPTKIWFAINVYPSGSGLSVYFRDITQDKLDEIELKKLNNSLKQKNEELEQFAFVTSHDLQEPLRIISSFMELLEKHLGDELDATAKKYIQYSIDGSHRMKQIIMDLLDYSRAGNKEENITEVDCNELMQQVTQLLEESINSQNASIRYDELPTLKFNPTALRQVMMNLIGNALKYVKKDTKPEIYISAQEFDNYFSIKVTDNGIGIHEKYYKHIFTIFKRLHNKSDYSGTGIGLAICKKVVEKYGGEISVISEEGKGSTFYFTILKNL